MKVNVIKTNKINIQNNGFVIKNGVLESCHIETGKVVIPEGVITISAYFCEPVHAGRSRDS